METKKCTKTETKTYAEVRFETVRMIAQGLSVNFYELIDSIGNRGEAEDELVYMAFSITDKLLKYKD